MKRGSAVSATTEHCYVVTDDRILSGEPIIKGTRTPVRAIVENWRLGIAPEEIPSHLPHLTLAQVFDALVLPQLKLEKSSVWVSLTCTEVSHEQATSALFRA